MARNGSSARKTGSSRLMRCLHARLFLVAVVSLVLVACGDSAVATNSAGNQPLRISITRAKDYHSIHSLALDADLVVRVLATSTQSVELVGPRITTDPKAPFGGQTPYTITTVKTRVALKGAVAPGALLKVRQLGAANVVVEDGMPLLQPTLPYVLFLTQFTYGPGLATDQYVLVGAGAGLFADLGNTASCLDAGSPDLPSRVLMPDLIAAL
jgi:hypothetical protein